MTYRFYEESKVGEDSRRIFRDSRELLEFETNRQYSNWVSEGYRWTDNAKLGEIEACVDGMKRAGFEVKIGDKAFKIVNFEEGTVEEDKDSKVVFSRKKPNELDSLAFMLTENRFGIAKK